MSMVVSLIRAARSGAAARACRTYTTVKLSPRSSTLEEAMKLKDDHAVMVFSASYCPFCFRAVETLEAAVKDADAVYKVDLDNAGGLGKQVRETLATDYKHRTVPAVFVGGKFLGGSDDLDRAVRSGDLDKLLEGAGVALRA